MTTSTAIDYKYYFEQGISYEEYIKNFEDELLIGEASPYAQYLPQNMQRQQRLQRKFRLNEALQLALDKLNRPLKWLLITEHWCGDASQINPIIQRIAEASQGKIELRMIYRDQHEDLIDAHLTDGRSRSIPILLQLDAEYRFEKSYGPRPEEAQQLVKGLLAKEEAYSIPLHSWYAKDKQRALSAELVEFLS